MIENIITVQHTESVHHGNGMVGSWTDWSLSDLGKEQAKKIGLNLIEQLDNKKFVLYSSDLLRAKQTAKIIGQQIGITPVFAEELRERNLGMAVGKSVQWLKENLQCQEKTVDDKMFPDAESRREVWNRLSVFYGRIMREGHENIIIVSHGDTLSIFNAMWLGLEIEALNHGDLYGMAGGVSFMSVDGNTKHIIRRMSDLSFIK